MYQHAIFDTSLYRYKSLIFNELYTLKVNITFMYYSSLNKKQYTAKST